MKEIALRLLGAFVIAVVLFMSGAGWERSRQAEKQTQAVATQFENYRQNVAQEIESSNTASNVLIVTLNSVKKSQTEIKKKAVDSLQRDLLGENYADLGSNDPSEPEKPVVKEATCPGFGSYRFSLATVGLFNAALANLPAPDSTSGSNEESRAPSTIGVEALVGNYLEVVRLYHELALRHDTLVEYVQSKQKEINADNKHSN